MIWPDVLAMALHPACGEVRVSDGVAVQFAEDGTPLVTEPANWVRPASLPYDWDEWSRPERSKLLAEVMADARMTREELLALRDAVVIALGELA